MTSFIQCIIVLLLLFHPVVASEPNAMQVVRTVPAGIAAAGLLVRPLTVNPGVVTVDVDPVRLAYTIWGNTANNSTVYVDCQNGSDANSGSISAPWQTPSRAVINSSATNVIFFPGTCPTFDFDAASPGGSVLKHLKTLAGTVTFTVAGPALSAQTWTATEYPGVYQTALAGTPHHVLSRLSTDYWGFEQHLPVAASLSALASSGFGWFFSSGTLYVAYNGYNINSVKSLLRALYLDSNGNARLLFEGTRVILDGDFIVDGANIWGLGHNYGGGVVSEPQVFLRGTIVQFAVDHGVSMDGGLIYSEDVWSHASMQDDFNCRPSFYTSKQGLCIEHNDKGTDAGDTETFGTAETTNRNGHSAEPGANAAIFGGLYEGSFGPDLVDVGGGGFGSVYSWYVGVVSRSGKMPSPIGIEFANNPGTGLRTAWVDTCTVISETTSLYAIQGATAMVYNNHFNVAPTTDSAGVITTYDPTSP